MIARTEAQQEASRRNGALSRGPKTAEGKSVSARNAEKHGMTGHAVVLRTESREEFEKLLADYTAEYQPRTRREMDLIQDLVTARWRLNRIITLETAALDHEIESQRPETEAGFIVMDEATRAARAFSRLGTETRDLANYGRFESRLRRAIDTIETRLTAIARRRNPALDENAA